MKAIPVLYEDKDLLVINKPAGIDMAELQTDPRFQFPAHRLDKDTSGALLIAKNEAVKDFLQNQFKDRQVKKTYQALVYGEVKDKEGVIDYPIGRSRNDPRKRVARVKTVGKEREAVTNYKVVKVFPGFSYVEAYPQTGRTHQIRVHFKAIGHPIVGDKLYAENKPNLSALERQALHAAALEFGLPNGETKRIEAPLPADMASALEKLESVC